MNASPDTILNFRQLSPSLATGGQPDAEELRAVCRAGYQVVINLGLENAPYSLPGERRILAEHGLAYHHLPVDFQAPEAAQFVAFCTLLQRIGTQRCFIHCAANKRVSTFIALYRVIELGWSRAEAEEQMRQVWDPDPVWRDFMESVLRTEASKPD